MRKQSNRFVCLAAAMLGGTSLSTAVLAQDTAQLEEVVITASRRAESLQRVPISAAAVSAERIENLHPTNLSDVLAVVPSLQVVPAFAANNPAFAIRGQVQNDTSGTLDPSVAVYSDEVYIARAAGALTDMLDIERVEVLNGPQGSLFGRNTTGGAVVITTKRPVDALGGWVSGSYASRNEWSLKGVLNTPLIGDKVLLRLATQHVEKRGFMRNPVTGNYMDWDDRSFVRGTVSVKPNDKLTILLRGDYTREKSGGLPSHIVAFNPNSSYLNEIALENGVSVAQARTLLTDYVNNALADRSFGSADSRWVTYETIALSGTNATFGGAQTDTGARFEVYGFSGTIEYDFDWAQLRSITAYRRSVNDYILNVDGSFWAVQDSSNIGRQSQVSQEVLLSGNLSWLDWSIGGQYFDENGIQASRASSLSLVQAVATGAGGTFIGGDFNAKSMAGFGQLTVRPIKNLSLTAGGRYTRDKRSIEGFNQVRFIPDIFVCGLPASVITPGSCLASASKSFNKLTYNFAADYKIDDDRMVYAHYSIGYRSGGFNVRLAVPESLAPFGPEVVTEKEVGFKANWFSQRLRTNFAYFWAEREDLQVTRNAQAVVSVVDSNGVTRTFSTSYALNFNQGTAHAEGYDLNVEARPVDWLTIGLNHVHLTAKPETPAPLGYMQLSPKNTWTVWFRADQDFLGGAVNAALSADYSYRSQMLDSSFVTFPVVYQVRRMLNASLRLTHNESRVQLSIFGRNLTNSRFYERHYGIPGLNYSAAVEGAPRTIGFVIKVPFGEPV